MDLIEDATPKVSVCVITYNHEKYIEQAIQSILSQEFFEPIEIIIGDDCSTDKTQEICKGLQEKFPSIIKLNRSSTNIGVMANFISTLEKAKGKYIALCDGDDYWTDNLKLKKQVDFLETHPDYVICGHDCFGFMDSGEIIQESVLLPQYKKDCTKDDLLKGFWVMTQTMCFRNIISKYPEEMYKVYNGDIFLTSILGEFGHYKYMDDVINKSAYRYHQSSFWSKKPLLEREIKSINTSFQQYNYFKKHKSLFYYQDFYKSKVLSTLDKVLSQAVVEKSNSLYVQALIANLKYRWNIKKNFDLFYLSKVTFNYLKGKCTHQ